MSIQDRAAQESREILAQFERLEALGAFAGEPVGEQKHVFLTMSLTNFARREKLIHGDAE